LQSLGFWKNVGTAFLKVRVRDGRGAFFWVRFLIGSKKSGNGQLGPRFFIGGTPK
jgi:hypothetical protein